MYKIVNVQNIFMRLYKPLKLLIFMKKKKKHHDVCIKAMDELNDASANINITPQRLTLLPEGFYAWLLL